MFSNSKSKLNVHELFCLITIPRNKAETKLVRSVLVLQFFDFSGLYFALCNFCPLKKCIYVALYIMVGC